MIRRFLISLILCIAIVTAPFALTGCGSSKTLQQAAEAAKDIGGGTRDVIKAVREAYEKGLITKEQKDHFADLLGSIARGGKKGVDVIDALFKSGVTDLTADKASLLNKAFSDEVIAPFLELITDIAKLSDSQSMAIRAAIAGLRTTILLLSQRIGRNDVIEQINAAPWKPYVAAVNTWRCCYV